MKVKVRNRSQIEMLPIFWRNNRVFLNVNWWQISTFSSKQACLFTQQQNLAKVTDSWQTNWIYWHSFSSLHVTIILPPLLLTLLRFCAHSVAVWHGREVATKANLAPTWIFSRSSGCIAPPDPAVSVGRVSCVPSNHDSGPAGGWRCQRDVHHVAPPVGWEHHSWRRSRGKRSDMI